MSNTKTNPGDLAICKECASTSTLARIPALFRAFMTLMVTALLLPLAQAQTINFTGIPPIFTPNLFVGGGYVGSYTNLQFKATLSAALDPANPVTYNFTPSVTGVTFSTGATGTTNTVITNIVAAVNNAALGTSLITITPFTNGVQFGTATATFNLVVGNLWTNLSQVTVPTATPVLWGTAANWSSGAAPGIGDNVLIQDAGGNTNFVNTPTTIGSLSYIRATQTTNFFTTIADGATLAIAGANGFSLNEDVLTSPAANRGTTVRIAGFAGATLVVTNQSANYAVNGASSQAIGANSGTSLLLTNLDKQFVSVNRVGFGDATLMDRGAIIAEQVFVELAKTNVFISSYSNSFGGLDFTNSFQCFNQYDIGTSAYSSGNAMTLNLGISNIFLGDSFRVGGIACQGLSIMKFAPVFTNGVVPVAIFRSTNGGRMSFFGVAVQSGLAAGNRFSRASLLFNQGIVDMKVDTMWLGANRTNDTSKVADNISPSATITFGGTLNPNTPSIVDVNTLIAGNQIYTNNHYCIGNINVQTNALLIVNNYLELGHEVGDTNFGAVGLLAAKGFGNLTINGGTARVNRINVGDLSTNNQVVLGIGGHLIVSNTIASAAKSLTTLNVNGAKITFRVASGVTNAFVTNLVTGASATLINIASISGFAPNTQATNVLIAYQDSAASHNVAIGSLPAGFNNLQVVDDVANKVVVLKIFTNAPKTLAWRGGASSDWNHSDLNWLDTNSLTITKFTDGDKVIFDDTAAVPTTINITETINPGQNGTGIFVSNSVNAFTLSNGGGSIGNCALVKAGTASLTNNAPTTVSAQINNGKLAGSGSVGGTTIASGASLNFSGTINGVLTVAGTATLSSGGIAANSVIVQSTGVMTNIGTIQGGALTLNSGAFLFNATGGNLLNIGNNPQTTVNVDTNATFINQGDIGSNDGFHPNTLGISGTFKDLGVGNIYLTTLTFNGGSTFIPGGDGIGTTEIQTATVGSTFPGRLTLLAGSTTLIKVDFANPQTNTIVKAQFTDFGGNTAVKSFDGSTVVVSNINTGGGVFASGQSFRMFSGPGTTDIGNEGLNTTNRYPIITPVIPAANTKWDLASLRDTSPNGFANIIGFPTTGTNLTFSTFSDSGSIVTHLQWPSEYIGWRLQQQTNALNVGIGTNWTTVSGSTTTNDLYITNSGAIDTSFFRMIYP